MKGRGWAVVHPDWPTRPELHKKAAEFNRTNAMRCFGVFAAGMCLGAFLAPEIIRHGARRGFQDPDWAAAHILSRMRADLDLTEEQADRDTPDTPIPPPEDPRDDHEGTRQDV